MLVGYKDNNCLSPKFDLEIGDSIVNIDKTCSNRENKENEYGYCISTAIAGRVHTLV